jgi:hypothetical protein
MTTKSSTGGGKAKGGKIKGGLKKSSGKDKEAFIITPTKKPKIDAGRMGVLPRMAESDIDQLTSDDSKKIVNLLHQMGEFLGEAIKSSNLSLSASPNSSPAANFDVVWKNNMGYCPLSSIIPSLLLRYCILRYNEF